jgi:hypothetical protein
MNQKTRDLLRRLVYLSKRGVGGEAVNAQELLIKLLDRYDATIEELESEEMGSPVFKILDVEFKLFIQVVVSILGGACERNHIYETSKSGYYWMQLTRAEEVELRCKLAHYKEAWRQAQDDAFASFVMVNGLYACDGAGARKLEDLSKEEREELKRIERLAKGMASSPYHKQLD